jgi:hypothetical protein
MSVYNVKVDPTEAAESFNVGCDQIILHVICFDPGNFSVVFAVVYLYDVENIVFACEVVIFLHCK